MKKKILKLILAVCMILPSAVVLSGCFGGDSHTHTFKEVPKRQYMQQEATCQHKAIYYKSCECGASSHETFEYGELADHQYYYVPGNEGTHTKYCYTCDFELNENCSGSPASCTSPAHCNLCLQYYGSPEHSFGVYASNGDATCEQDGTKTAYCSNCGEPDTIVDENSRLGHDYGTFSSNYDGTHTKTCQRKYCNSKITDNCTGGTATCSSQKICETCLTGYGDFLDHDYDSDNNICHNCNTKLGSTGLSLRLGYDKRSYRVTGIGDCTDEDVIIPDRYNGLPVTMIDEFAFKYNTTIKSITIPYSISLIDQQAFNSCSSLEGVYISDIKAWVNITFVGHDANPLSECGKLYLNDELVENLTLPDGVTNISYYAFSGCSSLTNITIPSSVTTIGDCAFYNCSSLTEITLPNSVTTIEDYAFFGCSSLTTITIPSSVTTIGDYAFYECSSLTSINIPSSVTTIGESAFSGCSSLTAINIPNSVTTIGAFAFSGCSSLTTITIPSSITTFSNGFIGGCSSLTTITIPDSVTTIEANVFGGCDSLKELVIPNSVTTIDDYAFSGKSGIEKLTIPFAVRLKDLDYLTELVVTSGTEIKEQALEGCKSLKKITLPNGLTTIGASAFSGCSSLADITLPNTVTTIGDYAFYECSSLTTINIPSSVTTINSHAFSSCSSLADITLPSSITKIGESAFSGCSSLSSVALPNGLTSI